MTIKTKLIAALAGFCAFAVVAPRWSARHDGSHPSHILIEAHATTPLALPLIIGCGDVVEIVGDSFIEGYGNGPGQCGAGWTSYACWTLRAQEYAHQNPTALKRQTNSTVIPWTSCVTYVNDGRSGTGNSDILTNISTRVLVYSPTIILQQVSQNDWATNPTTWTNTETSIANAVDAAFPTVRFALISNFFGESETWTSSGWDQSVGTNSSVTALNNTAKAWLATRDQSRYVFIDIRGNNITDPHTVLNYESINNPGQLTSGILMQPTFHPIWGPGGKQLSLMLLANLNLILN